MKGDIDARIELLTRIGAVVGTHNGIKDDMRVIERIIEIVKGYEIKRA